MTVADARAGERSAREATGGAAAIQDYGVIGDCRSAALVSNRGSIDWLCWPRFDSAPLFSRLLDPRGGRFAVEPEAAYETRQDYAPHSNTLVTRFSTPSGRLTLTDTLYCDNEPKKRTQFLPQSMLIRRIEACEGPVDIRVTCTPTRGFSLKQLHVKQRGTNSFLFPVEDGA